MAKIDLIATAAFGLEAMVGRELKKLGCKDVQVENNRVKFTGDELTICRTNLWLRTAGKVLIKMGEFEATTFDELFDQTKELPWHEWLPKNACFPIKGRSAKSQLSSEPACQSIVKKAIVESMKEHYGTEWFEEDGPLYSIIVSIQKDVATLTIDTSGAGLHKRGYRDLSAVAPLRETLGAALVDMSRWDANPERPFIDPTCGSGTIPIEAALKALNIAPGSFRKFASEDWPRIPKELWKQVREEAKDLVKHDLKFRLMGYDSDERVLSLARHHAQNAGVEEYIDFHQRSLGEQHSNRKYGCVISNPPYGERLSERPEVEKLYKEMGRVFKTFGDGSWSFFILTSLESFEKHFGTRANKKRKLYNGRIKVDYYQYFGPLPPRRRDK
ncbi:MAG: class I SAM-dependent RNA methyltransferase [Halanaerobiales bacterium]|nr:class I SAM-dependent RNA methyltransferase [Halanaerobiales bacterium]